MWEYHITFISWVLGSCSYRSLLINHVLVLLLNKIFHVHWMWDSIVLPISCSCWWLSRPLHVRSCEIMAGHKFPVNFDSLFVSFYNHVFVVSTRWSDSLIISWNFIWMSLWSNYLGITESILHGIQILNTSYLTVCRKLIWCLQIWWTSQCHLSIMVFACFVYVIHS